MDLDRRMSERNAPYKCPCGHFMIRSYRVMITTQTASEKFFGGKYWNGHNTKEKVDKMKADVARNEASWLPAGDIPEGMTAVGA